MPDRVSVLCPPETGRRYLYLPGQPIAVRQHRDPLAYFERLKQDLPKNLTPEQREAALRALRKKAGL